MRKLILPLIAVFSCSMLFAQHSLEKIWESDSTTLKGPESATYDAKSNSIYVSSMNAGAIVKLGLDGKFLTTDWVKGLSSNKGLGFYKGMLYTAETAAVAVIDIEKAAIVKRIPIEGAGMLNDLAVDAKGIIYVSDTRKGTVHRIENDIPALYLENMPGANGLLCVNTDVYLVTGNSFFKINANKEVIKIADGFVNGLDGIVMLSDTEFILSNYTGMLYAVKTDGSKEVLLDSRANRIMANDISYNPKTKTLFVPSFSGNRIIAYTVK